MSGRRLTRTNWLRLAGKTRTQTLGMVLLLLIIMLSSRSHQTDGLHQSGVRGLRNVRRLRNV